MTRAQLCTEFPSRSCCLKRRCSPRGPCAGDGGDIRTYAVPSQAPPPAWARAWARAGAPRASAQNPRASETRLARGAVPWDDGSRAACQGLYFRSCYVCHGPLCYLSHRVTRRTRRLDGGKRLGALQGASVLPPVASCPGPALRSTSASCWPCVPPLQAPVSKGGRRTGEGQCQ